MTARLYEFRRIGVCGSSIGLSRQAAELCKALGCSLERYDNVAIVSGGTKQRRVAFGEENCAADWFVVSAAESVIPPP